MSTQPQNQKRRNDRIQINVSFGFTLIFTSFHIISQHLAMEIYNRKNLFFSHKLLTKVSPPTAPTATRPSFTTGGDDDHGQQAKHDEDSTKGILDGNATEDRIRSLVMRQLEGYATDEWYYATTWIYVIWSIFGFYKSMTYHVWKWCCHVLKVNEKYAIPGPLRNWARLNPNQHTLVKRRINPWRVDL